jgi:hypothetical protein
VDVMLDMTIPESSEFTTFTRTCAAAQDSPAPPHFLTSSRLQLS